MPPDGVITTEPVAPPKHDTFTCEVNAADSADAVLVIVPFPAGVPLFASVFLYVFAPAVKPV